MSVLTWILISTGSITLISLIGLFTLFLNDAFFKKIILPLVAFSAGALLAGAFLHMIPEAIDEMGNELPIYLWILGGFSLFFVLEQFIHWHHCHRAPSDHKEAVTYLILVADAVHNFIGGLAIAGAFIVDIKVGIITWIAAAAHEIPQELGDFGILIKGGWSKKKALLFNFISALSMMVSAILAYYMANKIDVAWLLPFAAGNFIYIASSDLIPEIKHHHKIKNNIIHFLWFLTGIALILIVKLIFE